jgi:DNA-binding phage protein
MTPPVDPHAIALRLKSLIDLHGGPTDVARKAGLNTSTVDSYYRATSLPGALAIACLCDALEISADWLLFGGIRK